MLHSDIQRVRECLARGDDPNVRDDAGRTPLYVASAMAASAVLEPITVEISLAMVRLLLDHGADPNAQTKEGATPLLGDCCCPDLAAMQVLVKHGADVNLADHEGVTPLIKACETLEDLPTVQYLAEQGAKINTADKQGRTALHEAAREDEEEVASYLIARGADVNARDKAGRTPLFYAMDDPDEFTTHSPPILLAAGADVNVVDLQGTSLLEEAVWFGFQRDFAKQLLKHGAKFTIHAAAGFGFATKVRELVAEGVDPNRQLARDGTAPLHWAARLGQTEAARALIEVGADVDLQDGQGRRPLHYACGRYLMRPIPKADVTRVLLEAGADTGATTAKGETAAQIAQRSLQEDALAVLQEYAARQ